MDYTGDIAKFSFVVRQIVDKFIAQYIDTPTRRCARRRRR